VAGAGAGTFGITGGRGLPAGRGAIPEGRAGEATFPLESTRTAIDWASRRISARRWAEAAAGAAGAPFMAARLRALCTMLDTTPAITTTAQTTTPISCTGYLGGWRLADCWSD
jgi:hypothetical protein